MQTARIFVGKISHSMKFPASAQLFSHIRTVFSHISRMWTEMKSQLISEALKSNAQYRKQLELFVCWLFQLAKEKIGPTATNNIK